MSGTQLLILSGRVGGDAKISNGQTHSCFRFGVPTDAGQDDTLWHNVEFWVPHSRYPYFEARLKKGALVHVVAEVRFEKDGNKPPRYCVKASDVTVLQVPPDFVRQPAAERHEEAPYPGAAGYGPPGSLPQLGAHDHGHGHGEHEGYGRPPQQPLRQPYAGHDANGYGRSPAPPSHGHAPPAPADGTIRF